MRVFIYPFIISVAFSVLRLHAAEGVPSHSKRVPRSMMAIYIDRQHTDEARHYLDHLKDSLHQIRSAADQKDYFLRAITPLLKAAQIKDDDFGFECLIQLIQNSLKDPVIWSNILPALTPIIGHAFSIRMKKPEYSV